MDPLNKHHGLVSYFAALVIISALLAGSAFSAQAADGCGRTAGQPTGSLSKPVVRKVVRCLVNLERGSDLKGRRKLSRAAQRHSSHMQRSRCFDHFCSGEPSTESRIRSTGYFKGASNWGFGEVIARGRQGIAPRKIVKLWMESPSHRSTLLDSRFRHMGVGVSARKGKAYYTVDLGYRSR